MAWYGKTHVWQKTSNVWQKKVVSMAKKTGRPPLKRLQGTPGEETITKWTVRGVDRKFREMAVRAAHDQGMTLGSWLERSIIRLVKSDQEDSSAGHGSSFDRPGHNLPARQEDVAPPKWFHDQMTSFSDRLAKLENRNGKSGKGGKNKKGKKNK